MGRVSKHKKIKSCDPFYKGPRRNPTRKGDLPPPNDDDQPPPKALLQLFKHKPHEAKKGATDKSSGGKNGVSMPVNDQTVSRERAKKPKESFSSVDRDPTMFVKQPGESAEKFLERVDFESKIKIMECFRKEGGKSERRKKYLEKRQQKFKSKKKPDLSAKTFEDFKDEVKFGEVVKAPPRLSTKPKVSSQLHSKESKRDACAIVGTSPAVSMVGLKHKHDIEEERTRAICEYRLAKKIKLKHQ